MAETSTNTVEHQVVPGCGHHMERMIYCPGWEDLFLRQWNFTLLTHTHTKIKVNRVGFWGFFLNFTSFPQKFESVSDE